MARGKKIEEQLVPFNTKVRASTKELIDSIVTVDPEVTNLRLFLEEAVELYKEKYPEKYEKVKTFMKEYKRNI